MTEYARESVLQEVLQMLRQLAGDWGYDGDIAEETWLFADLGFQSLDAVVLGNALQERLGRPIPYGDLLAEIGQRDPQDVTVAEWVDFTLQHLNRA